MFCNEGSQFLLINVEVYCCFKVVFLLGRNILHCYCAFISLKEVTLKLPGRTTHRIVKTQIREHEAWKLQQVI